MQRRSHRLLATLAISLPALALSALPDSAEAAPAKGSASASAGSSGTSSSAKGKGSSTSKPKGKKDKFELPDFVYGGNAISFQAPVQVGFVAFMPRVRLGLQYDRQLHKAHWIHVGVAALLDRGNYATFRTNCGYPSTTTGVCGKGTVAGMDAYLGYTHKWYIKERPYLVPYGKLSLGGGFWKYPQLGGTREQYRVSTWNMSIRAGGGLRIFLLRELALGIDLNLQVGFAVHKDHPQNGSPDNSGQFLMGLEILPVNLEYRF